MDGASSDAGAGVRDRTFRRWVERYREEDAERGGVEALRDRRVCRASPNEIYSMFFRKEEGLEQFPAHARGDQGERPLLHACRASHYRVAMDGAVTVWRGPRLPARYGRGRERITASVDSIRQRLTKRVD